jgi:hypothetical protein
MWSKEKRRAYQREYDKRRYQDDAAYREKKKQYYREHKKERTSYNSEYRKRNAEKIRAYQRNYHRNMRQRANDTGREEE